MFTNSFCICKVLLRGFKCHTDLLVHLTTVNVKLMVYNALFFSCVQVCELCTLSIHNHLFWLIIVCTRTPLKLLNKLFCLMDFCLTSASALRLVDNFYSPTASFSAYCAICLFSHNWPLSMLAAVDIIRLLPIVENQGCWHSGELWLFRCTTKV